MKSVDTILPLALRALPRALADLRRRGGAFDDHVYAFFDASEPPGINIATAALQNEHNLDEKEARSRVDAMVEKARRLGQPFSIGAMLEPANLLGILSGAISDEESRAGIDDLRGWLAKPIPLSHFRVIVIAGRNLKAQFVEVVLKSSAVNAGEQDIEAPRDGAKDDSAALSSSGKRKVRSLVFQNGELHEFKFLEDALERSGGQLAQDLVEIIEEDSTVLIVEPGGDLPEEWEHLTVHVSENHKAAFAAAALLLLQTLSVRDPVLVVDVGEQFFMVSTRASSLERYLKQTHHVDIPLETPPADKMARWVVTIATDGSVHRGPLGFRPRPGIGQA